MASRPENNPLELCSSSRPLEVLVFSSRPNSEGQRRTRSQLSEPQRAKVHSVRLSGACLACRMLKVPCDPIDPENHGPCQRCLTVRSHSHQRGTLAFRECIRTSISAINIFRNSLGVEVTPLDAPKLERLLAKTITSENASPSLESMVSDVFTWILNNKPLDQSIVGMLCSNRFSELSRAPVDTEFAAKFQALLYSSTLAYVYASRTTYDYELSINHLHRITYATGSDILQYIDKKLSPHILAKLTRQQLRVMFLVLFGVTSAIAYSVAIEDSPDFPGVPELYDGQIPKTLWDAMQQHLVQIMAHHLVLLAHRLKLTFPEGSERHALSSSMTGITQRGVFTWVAEMMPTRPSKSVFPGGDDELSRLLIPTSANSDPTMNFEGEHFESYRSGQVSAGELKTVENSLRPVPQRSDSFCNRASGVQYPDLQIYFGPIKKRRVI